MRDEKVEPGSGNLFAHLGLRDAEERLLKSKAGNQDCSIDRVQGLGPRSFVFPPTTSLRESDTPHNVLKARL